MHQQPRNPQRVPSSASSPQSNTARSNNPRDVVPSRNTRDRASSSLSARDAPTSLTADQVPGTVVGPPLESVKKLDQIVQNFYNKAAVLVLNSRMKVRPTRGAQGNVKVNKWFQLETDEIDDFREDLKTWKTCGSIDNRPPPMFIEVYLDTSRLKDNQSLVAVDEDGKRWDVMEQLNSSETSTDSNPPSRVAGKTSKVVLERWRIELKPTGKTPTDDFGPILPTIYKKAIVYFRSLFITTRLLPCWKFASQGPAKSAHHPCLTPLIRIMTVSQEDQMPDLLRTPIDGKPDAVTEYVFGDLDVPVGRLSSSVTYRNECSFRVDDSEALLSSRFMGVDEHFFRPSMPQQPKERGIEVGSLRDRPRQSKIGEVTQTYGSLSTFHGENAPGTSPMSALRAVRPPGSDTDSPPASLPTAADIDPPNSLPISGRPIVNHPALRSGDGHGRRTSISFQPFKAGSLSGSPVPRQMDSDPPPSPHSLSRPSAPPLSQPRNRTSLTAGMPASLRGGPPATNTPEPALASSPRPPSGSRYSSSFTHRRGRLSVGGTPRPGDDETSSGRQSLASSVAQPGSSFLAEAEAASSGSFHGDDNNNISDFLKALDSKKTLKSFEPTKVGDSAANRTVAQLSKFHMMKESNAALTDSMTSSMQMHRSSSSSSRQLTSVPGMIAPASMSASSSPGKPVSPHTPHTPAIPSRLSTGSVIDNSGRITSRHARAQEPTVPEVSRENTITQEGTSAIPIPTSPRVSSHQRRSSSLAQSSRAMVDDDDSDLAFAAQRSISLGTDDREPPTMSILLGQHEGDPAAHTNLQPAADIQPSSASQASNSLQRSSAGDSNPLEGLMSSAAPSSSPYGRRRYTGMSNRRATPPQSARGSFTGSVGRPGGTRGDDESLNEEPLVFDLSEMDPGRRSIDGGREGYQQRGTARRGW